MIKKTFRLMFIGLVMSIALPSILLSRKQITVEDVKSTTILKMYQMIKDVHELFENNGLEYWIMHGTLLGAVRHKGIIPWDDDIDICIDHTQEDFFLSLIPQLEALGYGVATEDVVIRIFPQDGTPAASVRWNDHSVILSKFKRPFIDLAMTMFKDGERIFCRPKVCTCSPDRLFGVEHHKFKEATVFPLRDYQFGEMTLKGPNDAHAYLNAIYLPDWETVAYKWNKKGGEKEGVVLSDQDKLPAQPTGPLEDRVIR